VDLAGNVGPLYKYDATGVIAPQYGSAPGTTAWVAIISQGTIVVTDSATNATIWQVDTRKKYRKPDKAMKNLEQEINSVMKKAISSFPARPKGK
jgi:hypothetical protein